MEKKNSLIVQVELKKQPTSNQNPHEIYFRLSARSCILVYASKDIKPDLSDAQSFLRNLVRQVLINSREVNSCYGFLVAEYKETTFWKAHYYIVCHFKKKVSSRNRDNFSFISGARQEYVLLDILNVESGLQRILGFNTNPQKRVYSFSLTTNAKHDWGWKYPKMSEEEAYWLNQNK